MDTETPSVGNLSTLNVVSESVTCILCSNETPREGMATLEDSSSQPVCTSCLENECFECTGCGDNYHENNRNISPDGEYYCQSCFDDRYFVCDSCDRTLSNDDYDNDGVCVRCNENDDDQNESHELQQKIPDFDTLANRSNDEGEIIKSTRTFGVELETVYTNSSNAETLRSEIPEGFGLVHDGSISTSANTIGGIEIVSSVLQGQKGEQAIKDITHLANENGFKVNRTCGFHLHLGAEEFARDTSQDRKEWDRSVPQAIVRYEYVDADGFKKTESAPPIAYDREGNTIQRDFKIRVKKNLVYKMVNRGEAYARLQKLLAIYSTFDDVFRALQPKSRRMNTYCHSVSKLYSLEDIKNCSDYEELETMYYREQNLVQKDKRKQGGKYDQSRYSALNLHILFSKGKTIEIRYHTPTLNAEKILRWTELHQGIFDNFKNFNFESLERVASENTNALQKLDMLCKCACISEETKAYLIKRINLFNGEALDEETSN